MYDSKVIVIVLSVASLSRETVLNEYIHTCDLSHSALNTYESYQIIVQSYKAYVCHYNMLLSVWMCLNESTQSNFPI